MRPSRSRLKKIVEAFASHLRSHLVQAIADGGADLVNVVDVAAALFDQAKPVAASDRVLLTLGQLVLRHICILVRTKQIAVSFIGQRVRELVSR